MKSNQKLKGFTLIELIVVMAIFSVIMFGAMQLIQPVSNIFTTTYKQESVAASTDNIKRYIESNLRYAQYVRVTDSAPSHADLVKFVDDYYNGWVYYKDETTYDYISGDLYVMKIDNANGGKISQWALEYKAGDVRATGTPGTGPLDTGNMYLEYSNDGIASNDIPASDDDILSTVTPTFDASNPDQDWAINKAMYNDYNFNISLGAYELDASNMLVPDADYYLSFADSSQQVFGPRNFTMTITAYGVNPTKGTSDRDVSDPDNIKYNPGYVYSASLALQNVKANRKYPEVLKFIWHYDFEHPTDLTKTTYAESEVNAEGETLVKFHDAAEITANPMPVAVSDMAESDEIYIIYSYMGEDILKP